MRNRILKIGIIQHESKPKEYENNIKSVESYLQLIAGKNVHLVVLPELFATGYCANKDIFHYGENENGKTINWLKEKAKELGIYIGGGIPVYENGDLYNRFFLCNPDGEIEGFAQKQFGESYCFKRGKGIFSIHTELGNIGVSICADSHFYSVIERLQTSDIDILLMPHAWPTQQSGGQDEIEFSSMIAKLLNIPVVYINGVGRIEQMQGLMGKLMSPDRFELRGRSCIIRGDGNISAKLDNVPGVIIQDVQLGKVSDDKPCIPNYSGWIHPGPWLLRNIIIPFDIWMGKRVYKKNVRRINDKTA